MLRAGISIVKGDLLMPATLLTGHPAMISRNNGYVIRMLKVVVLSVYDLYLADIELYAFHAAKLPLSLCHMA